MNVHVTDLKKTRHLFELPVGTPLPRVGEEIHTYLDTCYLKLRVTAVIHQWPAQSVNGSPSVNIYVEKV